MRFGSVLPVGYGGIERTTSEDGMNCDVYVGMHLESPKLFRFTLAPDNQDAEYKWCIGFTDLTQCKAIIQSFIPQQINSDFREFNPAILTQYERATVQTEEV
jgi:hypothetical protein